MAAECATHGGDLALLQRPTRAPDRCQCPALPAGPMIDSVGSSRGARHAMRSTLPPRPACGPLIWLSRLLGAAMLGALVVGVLQLADASHFALVLSRAEPAAAGHHRAAGADLRRPGSTVSPVLTAAGTSLPLWDATKLSLTKLFIDRGPALPPDSGAVAVVALLQRRGIAASQVSSCFIVSVSAYSWPTCGARRRPLHRDRQRPWQSRRDRPPATFMLFCGLMAIAAPLIAGCRRAPGERLHTCAGCSACWRWCSRPSPD